MHTNSKRFFNSVTARGTFLRCPIWSDFLIPSPSAFSLRFEYREEHSPRCVRDTFGKMSVAYHAFDIKSFYSEAIVGLDKRIRNLVTKIKPLISNLFMMFSDKRASVFPTNRPFLSTRKPSLSFGKFLFSQSQVFRARNLLSITCGNKSVKANINPNRFAGCRKDFCLTFDGKRHIPLIIPTCDGKGLYIAINRSMPFNLNAAYILEIKSILSDLTAISKIGIRYCIKSIRRLKSGITGFFTCFHPTEEGFKGLVKSTEGLLKRTIVAKSENFTFSSHFTKKFCSLGCIANSFTGLFIGFFSLGKSLVVKKSVTFNLRFKGFGLFPCWIKSVFVRLNHLFALLVGYIVFNNCIANKTNSSNIIRTRPKSREFLSKVFILTPKFMGSKALELLNNIMNWQCRDAGYKHMNMIGHYFKGLNLHVNLLCFLIQKYLKVFGNFPYQNRLPVLRTPDNMIVDVVDTSSRYFISIVYHILYFYIYLAESQENYIQKGGYTIHLTVKTISPLA